MVQLYLLAGSIVLIGFMWFWIARPIVVSLADAYHAWRESHEPQTQLRHISARRTRRPLPRRFMSRRRVVRPTAELVRFSTEPAEPIPVRAHQNQLEPTEPFTIEPARDTLQLNRLSRAAEIALLAVQRNEDGTYRHSANAITQLMGGTAADVKKQIAEIRALPPEEQPKLPTRVDRPPRGWPKGALN